MVDLTAVRAPQIAGLQSGGRAARERASQVDATLARLAREALGGIRVGVVAVGGYGRGDLSPHSDIDLLFVVEPRAEVSKATLRGLLYPLWDAGFQVGHAVRSPKDAISFATEDLHAATALLSMRLVEGDAELFAELFDRRERWLARERKTVARRIADSVTERHRKSDRAGWVLAPDLKEDVGGLRDAHAAQWLAILADSIEATEPLREPTETLLAVREALHATSKRKVDRVRIDLQIELARALGLQGERPEDELMAHVHAAARAIEFEGALARSSCLDSVAPGPRRSGSTVGLAPGVWLEDGMIAVREPADGLETVLAVLQACSAKGRPVAARSIAWMRRTCAAERPPTWTNTMRLTFADLLAGDHVVSALELADHVGLWHALIPEWERVRALAQHDPYHRYTVDAHLFLAVAELARAIAMDRFASNAIDEAGSMIELRLATLLHDIGKGSGEDHSIAGERIARSVCERMGLPAEQTDTVAFLVRHHLLLVDTATRRDLDDGTVISDAADTIRDPRLLRLLYVLSIADGMATGPQGWTEWKAALVRDLYRKVLLALETGTIPARSDVRGKAEEVEAFEPTLAGRAEEVLETLPPTYLASTPVVDMVDEVRLLLSPPGAGEMRHRVIEGAEPGQMVLTMIVPDRPGTLARTAGVLALHRLSVLRAHAYSTTKGIALERFIVAGTGSEDWDKVAEDLRASYSGRLALEARLGRKVLDYHSSGELPLDLRILHEESKHSTVVEVRARDVLGLLYAVAAAIAELDLDIHLAKIDTLGERVVDVFYVRTAWGTKLEAAQAEELAHAIRHRVGALFGGRRPSAD